MIKALPAAAVAAICAVAPAAAQTPAEWQDVIRNLRHPNPQTRLDAVKRLGEAGYVPAAEAVSTLIADPDDRVQLAAIDAELSFFMADDGTRTRFGFMKSRPKSFALATWIHSASGGLSTETKPAGSNEL